MRNIVIVHVLFKGAKMLKQFYNTKRERKVYNRNIRRHLIHNKYLIIFLQNAGSEHIFVK